MPKNMQYVELKKVGVSYTNSVKIVCANTFKSFVYAKPVTSLGCL